MQDSDWEEEKKTADLMLNMSIKPFHVCVEKKEVLVLFFIKTIYKNQKSPQNFFEFGCMCYSNFSS